MLFSRMESDCFYRVLPVFLFCTLYVFLGQFMVINANHCHILKPHRWPFHTIGPSQSLFLSLHVLHVLRANKALLIVPEYDSLWPLESSMILVLLSLDSADEQLSSKVSYLFLWPSRLNLSFLWLSETCALWSHLFALTTSSYSSTRSWSSFSRPCRVVQLLRSLSLITCY